MTLAGSAGRLVLLLAQQGRKRITKHTRLRRVRAFIPTSLHGSLRPGRRSRKASRRRRARVVRAAAAAQGSVCSSHSPQSRSWHEGSALPRKRLEAACSRIRIKFKTLHALAPAINGPNLFRLPIVIEVHCQEEIRRQPGKLEAVASCSCQVICGGA